MQIPENPDSSKKPSSSKKPEKPIGEVKRLVFYIKDIFRFYDVGVPYLVQIMFLCMLGILFGGYVLSMPYALELNKLSVGIVTALQDLQTTDPTKVDMTQIITPEVTNGIINAFIGYIVFMLLSKIIVQGLSLYYACLWHLKRVTPGIPTSFIVKGFLGRLPQLIGVNLVFYIAIVMVGIVASLVFSLIGLVVPSLAIMLASAVPVLYFLANAFFVFRDMSVLVGGTPVFKTFKTVWQMVSKNKRAVIGNMMTMYILGLLVTVMAVGISSQTLVATFAATFAEVIILLVTQRLIVRMYEDVKGMVIHSPVVIDNSDKTNKL